MYATQKYWSTRSIQHSRPEVIIIFTRVFCPSVHLSVRPHLFNIYENNELSSGNIVCYRPCGLVRYWYLAIGQAVWIIGGSCSVLFVFDLKNFLYKFLLLQFLPTIFLNFWSTWPTLIDTFIHVNSVRSSFPTFKNQTKRINRRVEFGEIT